MSYRNLVLGAARWCVSLPRINDYRYHTFMNSFQKTRIQILQEVGALIFTQLSSIENNDISTKDNNDVIKKLHLHVLNHHGRTWHEQTIRKIDFSGNQTPDIAMTCASNSFFTFL